MSVRQRRADQVELLVRGYQHNVAHFLGVVTSAATELEAIARSMTSVADDASGLAIAAAEQTSVNV